MKLCFLLILFTINLSGIYGQAPTIFKHKIIMFDDTKKSILHENVEVDILIIKDSIEGEIVFSEIHKDQKIISGFINLQIGSKQPLEDVEWTDKDYFIIFNINGKLHSIFKLLSNDFAKQIHASDDAFTIGYEDTDIIPVLNDFIEDVDFKKPFVCSDKLYYDGQYYATVNIGNQCWFAENLNVGSQIQSGINQGTNCNDVKKYCYINQNKYCEEYGGLYQWYQLMCGETEERVQGICPDGWHIPNHDDWTTLERYICEDLGNEDCEKHFLYAKDEEALNWKVSACKKIKFTIY